MNLYGPLYAAAGAAGVWMWRRRLVARGVSSGSALLGIGLAAWCGIAAAVAVQMLVAAVPGALPGPPRGIALSGSTVIGGILGGSLATAAWARLRREGVGRWLDALAGAAPLAQAIGRLGCLSAGCCYGRPTTSWLGLPLRDLHGVVARRYPAQLLASAADLGILAAVLLLERRLASGGRDARGLLFGSYLGLYGAKRFLLEFLRATANPVVAGLTWAQLAAAAYLLAGVAIAAAAWRRRAAALAKPAHRC